LNPGLQLPIMSLMHILLNSIDADMKSEIGNSREGLRPYPLRFHVEEAGADAKLNQHGPQGVTYHDRHPLSTVPVARITAHATVPGHKTSVSQPKQQCRPDKNLSFFHISLYHPQQMPGTDTSVKGAPFSMCHT
jgi:hypothetical protein